MVTCVVFLSFLGIGNVNIEEVEKFLKFYLKRYFKVSFFFIRFSWFSVFWIFVV